MRNGSGFLSEVLSRQSGMSKGKGGSMYIFTPTFFGLAETVLVPKSQSAQVCFRTKVLSISLPAFATAWYSFQPNTANLAVSSKPTILRKKAANPNVPAPSTILNRLAALTDEPHDHDAEEKREKPSRSASFKCCPKRYTSIQHDPAISKRNEDSMSQS
ncbi:hypothetical protein JOM56_007662 [Amanita muscaria]